MKVYRCKAHSELHGVLFTEDAWVIGWGDAERSFTSIDRSLPRAILYAIRLWWKHGR